MLTLASAALVAGNPDRQGEAGAYELLINPWARSAGLHTMNTSFVRGVEAQQLNPAGISRINKTEIGLTNTQYLVGTGMQYNSLGLAIRMSKNGVLGIGLNSLSFGDIERTTVNNPEGNIGSFSPNFFNLGVSYSHMFENKISVGATFRMINESTDQVAARALALDAGVQYVTGEKENFKFGISLRNVGSKMRFSGQGLNVPRVNPEETINYPITYSQRAAGFELPSQLNIGMSYDLYFGPEKAANRVTLLGNFISNAFSRDNLGAGIEVGLGEMFALRGGYKYEFGVTRDDIDGSIDAGFAGGLTFSVPFKKGSAQRFNIDYAWRQTKIWDGIHNVTLRLSL